MGDMVYVECRICCGDGHDARGEPCRCCGGSGEHRVYDKRSDDELEPCERDDGGKNEPC